MGKMSCNSDSDAVNKFQGNGEKSQKQKFAIFDRHNWINFHSRKNLLATIFICDIF